MAARVPSRLTRDRGPLDALADWQATRDTLHMWMQMVGKTPARPRAPAEPLVARDALRHGARTHLVADPSGARTFEIDFDFIDHSLIVKTSDGAVRDIACVPRPSRISSGVYGLARQPRIAVKLWPVPTEADHTIPFTADRVHARTTPPRPIASSRCCGSGSDHQALPGTVSREDEPRALFWGAFDLASRDSADGARHTRTPTVDAP